jgi:hypothetical protein
MGHSRHGIAGRARGLAEEPFCRSGIPLGREQKLDGLTSRVHSSIQILASPLTYIGLIGAVAFVGGLQLRPAALVQLRCIGLDPGPDATGIRFHSPFPDDFGDVFVS